MSLNPISASSPYPADIGRVTEDLRIPSAVDRSSLANDRVALSIATNLVNQASIVSPEERTRIRQLQSAIEAGQYEMHPLELSIALIENNLIRF